MFCKPDVWDVLKPDVLKPDVLWVQERGWGGPNSNEGTDTVVLRKYMYFVPVVFTSTLSLFLASIAPVNASTYTCKNRAN
jgi:hypothetical protein